MILLSTEPQIFSRTMALDMVRELMAGELDGWTYHVAPVPGNDRLAKIQVYDGEGRFVGYF